MRRALHGLTLIEIALLLTIFGLLVTVALPAYRGYSMREKVAEAVDAAASAQATVKDYAHFYGELPGTAAISLPFITSKYVLSSAWAASGATGAIAISTRSATSSDQAELDSKAVVLTATYNSKTRGVDWVCGGTQATTVDSEYLPAHCK
jgi:type IV pilus assembly protein PilA